MKFCLILSFVLLGTVSSFHLKNEALTLETPKEEETLTQEQEISDAEEILASGEDGSLWEKEEATELVPVPATKEDENVCPKEEDIIHLTGTPDFKTTHFLLVRQPHQFVTADGICQRCYRGRLVSIHSFSQNDLIFRSSRCLNQGQVWIGGYISGWAACKRFTWLDGRTWNFAYWASGQPGNGGGRCVALCTNGGHWRRTPCARALPFVCSY